jgi:hypothetical protein
MFTHRPAKRVCRDQVCRWQHLTAGGRNGAYRPPDAYLIDPEFSVVATVTPVSMSFGEIVLPL